jgi:hypothetical protein
MQAINSAKIVAPISCCFDSTIEVKNKKNYIKKLPPLLSTTWHAFNDNQQFTFLRMSHFGLQTSSHTPFLISRIFFKKDP